MLPDAGHVAALMARLANRDNEVAFLRASLEREQEEVKEAQSNVNSLAAELSEARKQASVLIAATAGAFNAPRIAAGDTHSPIAANTVAEIHLLKYHGGTLEEKELQGMIPRPNI